MFDAGGGDLVPLEDFLVGPHPWEVIWRDDAASLAERSRAYQRSIRACMNHYHVGDASHAASHEFNGKRPRQQRQRRQQQHQQRRLKQRASERAFERGLEVLEEMKREGAGADVHAYNALLRMAARQDPRRHAAEVLRLVEEDMPVSRAGRQAIRQAVR